MLLRDLLWVCAGGAAGSGARFLVTLGALRAFGPAFPWGTLAVNAVGSCAVGAVMQLFVAQELSPTGRLLLATGFLGGFTTFSTFSWETLRLWQEGHLGLSAANAVGNLALSLLGVLAGFWLGRALGGGAAL